MCDDKTGIYLCAIYVFLKRFSSTVLCFFIADLKRNVSASDSDKIKSADLVFIGSYTIRFNV